MKTIEYKVSFEKMISRLPGLFAYLESDEHGNMILHKATDSSDGCWGKIVENIKLPNSARLGTILTGGNTYTFRTIIDYYYQYREELGSSNGFVKFVEKGIGKIKVPNNKKGVATPEFLYLSNVRKLYNELVKMNKECNFYNQNKDKFGDDKHMCCLCERFEQMGGTTFMNYVGSLIEQADTTATEYMGYADTNNSMTIDFDIDLKTTYQDFGIMTPYTAKWLPYKKYSVGDKVEYDGDVYICTRENNGVWSDDLLKVVFSETNSNGQRIFAKYSEYSDFQSILSQEAKDEYNKNRMVAFEKKMIDGKEYYVRPTDINDNGLGSGLLLTGTTDSKLVDLRRFATYYNDDGVAERPPLGEDWLFYYRKGVAVNIRTINDNLGNVADLSAAQEGILEAGESATDLAAYGDVIEDIVPITEEHQIKFIYSVGVHLNAEGTSTVVTDDDGNRLIKWNKFVKDNNDKGGIKYTETYNYEEGSDLDKLINGTFRLTGVNQSFSFTNYIDGLYDEKIPTYKFEFTTINNTFNYDKTIAHQNVNIVSLLTDFETYRRDFDEFSDSDLYREEFLNDITYKPTKDIDVHIERGSTSVFDKHIAFGSVKTLEGMLEYQNGSFFKMTIS